jgi:hypothetical protein
MFLTLSEVSIKISSTKIILAVLKESPYHLKKVIFLSNLIKKSHKLYLLLLFSLFFSNTKNIHIKFLCCNNYYLFLIKSKF